MQNGEDDEDVCPTIYSIQDISSRVTNEAKTALATNLRISDDLYHEVNDLVRKLSGKDQDLAELRRVFDDNSSSKATRQDVTENIYDMTKILKDLQACLSSVYVRAGEP
jgi:hypothetical protein